MIESFKYSVKNMNKYKEKLINTLLHLPVDSQPHPLVVTVLTIIATLQLIGAITHPDAYIHKATSWSDPNIYISSAFAAVSGTVLTLLYIGLLVARFAATEKDNALVQPGMCLRYLGVVLAYFRVVC